MYRLMIVDDEWIVQEGIKVTIENHFDDIEIVGVVSSGREAIEVNSTHYPDIILMDIKMPGINGIEAIQTIREHYMNTKFVIISAYEQFEYAKQAVELGVIDYILKPINQGQLIEAIGKAKIAISQEREQRFKLLRNREKLEKMMPVLEKGFIYAMLMHSDFKRELIKYKDIFEIKKERGYVMVIEVKSSDEVMMDIDLYPKIQNTIKHKCFCAIGPMIIDRITVVIFEDDHLTEYDQRIKAVGLAEAIVARLLKYEITIKIGIGSEVQLERVRHSLDEANHALAKIESEDVLHHNDVMHRPQKDSYSYSDIKDEEAVIIQLMERGQTQKLKEQLHIFFDKVKQYFDPIDVKNIMLELMVMVLSTSYKHHLDEAEVGYSTYLSEIKRLTSQSQLESWCFRKIMIVSDTIQHKKTSHVSHVILKAKMFIDENYAKDIGLNDVSKEVAISPQYFSTIFKEELGVNFIEYLRNKRVEIAKELLRDKHHSVKEICYKVGYNDPNYFSRLFKKLVGVSPTEYK